MASTFRLVYVNDGLQSLMSSFGGLHCMLFTVIHSRADIIETRATSYDQWRTFRR